MTSEIDEVLDRLPLFRGHSCMVTPLPGGLTNRNYRVVTDAGAFVVRVAQPGAELLGIDHAAERQNTRIAADAGIAAPVRDHGDGLLVVDYLHGRTWTEADLTAPGNRQRLAQAARTLHNARPFVNRFDMFELQRRYLTTVKARGFRLPDGYESYADDAARIEAALAVNPARLVPCNNDLLVGNVIDDGTRLWLIDYEYAGNNDPCFEFGSTWAQSELSHEQLGELVDYYFADEDADVRHQKLARASLWGVMANYGWTLWGCIQLAVSHVEYDYWGWALTRYEAAREQFASPELSAWLRDVQRDA